MKKILIFFIALGLSQATKAQVITAVPCDMLGMVMNVGSQETAISIYHSGQYMTFPQSENIFMWEFTDQQGNILHQDTIVDQSTIAFGHNWSLTDTINVTVHFVNDSANLDNWYISEGLPPNGNSINCLFEDQIYWSTGDSNPWGSWTFIHNNPGVDQNITNNCCINPEWIDITAPCPFTEDPVIGCDGIEYANYCVAEAAGITSYIDSMGNETILEWDCDSAECVPELDPDCFAFDIWDPVCGCDGVTYSNSAYAACNNIFEYSEGECEEVQCEQDLDNDGICEDHCEVFTTVVVDCECSFFNPNTYTVFFSTFNEESCELWEDCYCECYNDTDGDGICDEDEENVIIEEMSNSKKLLKTIDLLGREINSHSKFQLHIYDDGSIERKYFIK